MPSQSLYARVASLKQRYNSNPVPSYDKGLDPPCDSITSGGGIFEHSNLSTKSAKKESLTRSGVSVASHAHTDNESS